jgi:hypothetical protein
MMTTADRKDLPYTYDSFGIDAVCHFAERIGPGVVRKVAGCGGRVFVVTKFKYPNGDSINLYFHQGLDGNSVWVSEMGDALFLHQVAGGYVVPKELAEIRALCEASGIALIHGVLAKDITNESVAACQSFCEALQRVCEILAVVPPDANRSPTRL